MSDSIEIRRAPLTFRERHEKCLHCGHTKANHHNPDDECVICKDKFVGVYS